MSERTPLERLTAARERIAAAMGWRCVGRDTDCSASLVISREADFAEAIAERLERKKVRVVVRVERPTLLYRWYLLGVGDEYERLTDGLGWPEPMSAGKRARRVAEQLGLEVVE